MRGLIIANCSFRYSLLFWLVTCSSEGLIQWFIYPSLCWTACIWINYVKAHIRYRKKKSALKISSHAYIRRENFILWTFRCHWASSFRPVAEFTSYCDITYFLHITRRTKYMSIHFIIRTVKGHFAFFNRKHDNPNKMYLHKDGSFGYLWFD